MNLTEKPDFINWPACHYVFIEKIGPFQNTAAKAWQELNQKREELLQNSKIQAMMSLYKINPTMIYRAGAQVESKPDKLPAGFSYEKFEGGKYARFVLTGSYAQLPEACGKVFEIVKQMNLKVREGFFIENYVNDPKTTPEDKLITEILVPTE